MGEGWVGVIVLRRQFGRDAKRTIPPPRPSPIKGEGVSKPNAIALGVVAPSQTPAMPLR